MPTEARSNYLPEDPYLRQTRTYLNYMHASESTLDSGTASHSSWHDMLAIISSRYQYDPFLFFVADVMSNYLTTGGLKNFSLFPEAPWGVRPVAFATSATWLIRYWWRQQQTVNWPDWPVQRREVQLTSASQLNTSWDPSVTFYARSSWLSEKCRPIVWTVDCNCCELFKLYTVSIILVVARSDRNTRH